MSLIQGELGRLTVPELFRAIAAEKRSGRLSVEHRDELGEKRAEVYFREGEAYHARLSPATPRLGARLISAGLVSSEEVEEAVAAQSKFGETRRLGEVLVGNRLLRRPQLESIVREQIEDAIFDVLRWESGTFAFEPDLESDEDIGIEVSVENLVMETARRLREWQQIGRRVPSLEAIPIFTPSESAAIEVALTPEEWSFVSRVDGRATIAQLARACGFTNLEAGRYVFGLVSTGLLALEPSDSETFVAEAEALSHATGIEALNGHGSGPQVGLIELVRSAGGLVEGSEPATTESPAAEAPAAEEPAAVEPNAVEPEAVEPEAEAEVGNTKAVEQEPLVVVSTSEEPLVVELEVPVKVLAEIEDLVEPPSRPSAEIEDASVMQAPVFIEDAPVTQPNGVVEPEVVDKHAPAIEREEPQEAPAVEAPGKEVPTDEAVPESDHDIEETSAVEHVTLAEESPEVEPEAEAEEPPEVEPEAEAEEPPEVEPEDEAEEPEVIEEESPAVEPEIIEEETTVIEPEVVEETPAIEPEVIEEETSIIEPEIIEEEYADVEPEVIEETPVVEPEVIEEARAETAAPVRSTAAKITMPDPTFVEPERPTLAPVFAEASSLSTTTPEETDESAGDASGDSAEGTLVTTGSRVVAEEYAAAVPTESMSSVFADLARPLDEEFEAVKVRVNGERVPAAPVEVEDDSGDSPSVRPVDPSVDTSALIREFSSYGLDGEDEDAPGSVPSDGNDRKAKAAAGRKRPGIFGKLKR